MPRLTLNFHGVVVVLETDDEATLEPLRLDFSCFEARSGAVQPTLTIRLSREDPPPGLAPPKAWWLRGRGLRLRDEAGARIVLYDGGEVVLIDDAAGRGEIYCADPQRLHELAYLLVLSRIGERLDSAGLHRVHALGFEWEGRGGLVLLPSGGGKTSLALRLLRETKAGFLSEDTPLLDSDGSLRAFPLRWGVRDREDLADVPAELVQPFQRKRHGLKWLLNVDRFRERLRDRVPLRWVFLGARDPGPAGIRPAPSAAAAVPLLLNLVVGWGLPQMAEYTLRPGSAGKLAGIAWRRLRAASSVLRSCACHRFNLGPGPDEAARELERFLAGDAKTACR